MVDANMTQDNLSANSSHDYKYLFTVFTSTYNRSHTLHRVYQSLVTQTYRDFEWLIIDDGSVDGTRDLVTQWQQENLFPIVYVYQENQGKHIALNRGVAIARGELFLTLDSDDSCIPEALERFKYHWDNIPLEQKSTFSAVTCLCKDENGNIIGNKFPFDPTDSDSIEIRYRFKSVGEKWGFHRTEVMRLFPFPEILGCGCIPEGIVWSAIATKYKTRFVNEPLRIYWSGEDQVTSEYKSLEPILRKSRPHVLLYQDILNKELAYFKFAPIDFLISAIHFIRYSFHADRHIFVQFNSLNRFGGKIIWSFALPLGTLAYLKDRIKYS
jgi:glycosyltransferase involved in cell wall biosynthesis